jgi:hypothetical protein
MKLFIFSLLLLIAPCNSAKKIAQQSLEQNSKVLIVFQTTVCFGRCPVLTLTIDGETKMATFIGKENTEKIGNYTKPITAKELDELVKGFETAQFYSLNEEYLGNITDFPSKYITYTNNGKTKKVRDRSGAPMELTSLEKMLTDFANSDGWKKTEDGTNSKD